MTAPSLAPEEQARADIYALLAQLFYAPPPTELLDRVALYTGAYTLKGALDNPLVAIRGFLAAQGLQRRQSVHEPEDHFAALCEAMRHLVTRGDIAVQRKFFDQFIRPAANPLCAAVMVHPRAAFYGAAAKFAQRFIELEHDAFQMD